MTRMIKFRLWLVMLIVSLLAVSGGLQKLASISTNDLLLNLLVSGVISDLFYKALSEYLKLEGIKNA